MAEHDPQQEKCPIFPNCGSGKAQAGMDALMEHILQAYGEQSTKLSNVISLQEEHAKLLGQQTTIWTDYVKDSKELIRVATSMTNMATSFAEFRSDSKKSHDLLFTEVRELHEKKMSKDDAARYAKWTGGIIIGLVGLIQFGHYVLPMLRR